MAGKFDRLVATLPSMYKVEVNTIIRGLLKAWALTDDEIEVQIRNTKDQLFVSTAEGRYLDFLGNNVGVDRDPGLGMADADYRKLVPVLSFYPKQVRKTIIALLDVFWGPSFTRPNVNSGNVENFDFGPTPLLTGTANFMKDSDRVKGTGTMFTVELQAGDYIKPSAASGTTYQKVAAVISNTELQLTKPWSSDIALNTMISEGVIRELTYKVDNLSEKLIRFKPYAFDDITDISVEELVDYINNDPENSKYITADIHADPVAGDKLNIRTNTPGLLGAIEITGGDANDPTRLNFPLDRLTEVKASVYEINPNEIVIRIPSSVPVLRRSLKGAAHPKQTKTEIFSNAEIFDFSGLGASSTLTFNIDSNPYTVTFTHATDFADPANVTAEEVSEVIRDQLLYLDAFPHLRGNIKKVGLRTTEGSLEYQVTGGTANTVLGFTTTLQSDPDLIIANYPSSYIFNPTGQLFTVTSVKTTLSNTIVSGSILSALTVANASSFPNRPGKIMIDFGRGAQEGPISYNSRPNNSTLLIDASYVFQKEHVSGRPVNLVIDSPTIPRVTGDDYAVYIVGTEQARVAAQNLIKKLIAAGVVIRFLISFPEVLFECCVGGCTGPSDAPDYRGSLTGQGPLVF